MSSRKSSEKTNKQIQRKTQVQILMKKYYGQMNSYDPWAEPSILKVSWHFKSADRSTAFIITRRYMPVGKQHHWKKTPEHYLWPQTVIVKRTFLTFTRISQLLCLNVLQDVFTCPDILIFGLTFSPHLGIPLPEQNPTIQWSKEQKSKSS